jgi:hypothetical protein
MSIDTSSLRTISIVLLKKKIFSIRNKRGSWHMTKLILKVHIFFMYRKHNHVLKFYFNYSIFFTAFDK